MIRGGRAAKRAPSWQDIRAVYPPAAVCGAFRMHGAHILPKPAHFGCTARISCQEGAIFPPEAPFGIHGVKKLPRIDARERTVAKSCHYQSPENAFRAYPAIGECSGTHGVDILSSADIRECTASAYLHCQSPGRAALSTRGSGHSAFSGLNCWERLRVCAVSVGNHELASRSAKLCRIMC